MLLITRFKDFIQSWQMFKAFLGQLTVFLVLLISSANSTTSQQEIITCTAQHTSQACQESLKGHVCAQRSDGSYVTMLSPCQACKNKNIIGYFNGVCSCPKIKCPQGQYCADKKCQKLQQLSLESLLNQGYEALQQQKNELALVILEQALQRNPNNSYSLYLASLASYSLQKNLESLKYIKKAIEIDNDIPGYYIIRGRAFIELKKQEEAEKQFQKALELGFDDVGLVEFYRAQKFMKTEKYQDAIKAFEKALKYHPQKIEWYIRKAIAHTSNRENNMAYLTCKQGLKIDPQNQQLKLFMRQFQNIGQQHQKKLQEAQQKNLKPDEKQPPNPQEIKKYIQLKKEELQEQFVQKRLKQKNQKRSVSESSTISNQNDDL